MRGQVLPRGGPEEGERGRKEEGRGAVGVERGGKAGGDRARARGGGRLAEPGGGSRRSSGPAAPTGPTPFPVDALGRWVLRETAHVQGGEIEVTGLDSTSVLSTSHCARYAL